MNTAQKGNLAHLPSFPNHTRDSKETKVRDHHLVIIIENVLGFQIFMHDSLCVKVSHALENIGTHFQINVCPSHLCSSKAVAPRSSLSFSPQPFFPHSFPGQLLHAPFHTPPSSILDSLAFPAPLWQMGRFSHWPQDTLGPACLLALPFYKIPF